MADSRELSLAKELAAAAGKTMRRYFRADDIGLTYKQDASSLTVADTAINQMVLDALAREFPDHSVIAEEGSAEKASDYVWFCDPVDGTMPYSRGIPTSVFTIALAYQKRLVMGLVYDPWCDRLYTAEYGQGAWLNGELLKLPERIKFNKQIGHVDIRPGTFISRQDTHGDFIREFDKAGIGKSICLGSGTYGSMLVASGETQFVVFSGIYPWDTAGASLIIAEAGGRVSDFYGRAPEYGKNITGFVGAHPQVYNQIMALLYKAEPSLARRQR